MDVLDLWYMVFIVIFVAVGQGILWTWVIWNMRTLIPWLPIWRATKEELEAAQKRSVESAVRKPDTAGSSFY